MKYAMTLKKIASDLGRLQRVTAALMEKVADHDVIDDYMEERAADLSYQNKSHESFNSEVDKKVKGSRRVACDDLRAIEAEVEELEEKAEESEESEEGKTARVKTLTARLDKLASKIEVSNPKLAARLDVISNTLEKKYNLSR